MLGDHFLVLSNDHVDLQSGNYGELQQVAQNAKNASTYYRWFVPFICTGKMNCFVVRCEDTRSAALYTASAQGCAQSVEMLCLF